MNNGWQQVLNFALSHNAKTGDKVYIFGMPSFGNWIYGWTLNKEYAEKRKLARQH